jgi:hypothetical protein
VQLNLTRACRAAAASMVMAAAMSACGKKADVMDTLERVVLTPSDTVLFIDGLSGDSIFSVSDFQLSDGNVYVLDNISRRVIRIDVSDRSRSIFSRSGEAPGELLNPVCLVVTDQLVRVMDTANGLVCFDTSGRYIDSLSCHAGNLPMNLCPSESTSYIGLRSSNFLDDDGDLVAEVSVGLYTIDVQPVTEYYSYSMPLDLVNISDSFYSILTAVCYAADESSGSVFLSPMNEDRLIVIGCSSTGDLVYRIDEPMETRERTQEEVSKEHLELSSNPLTARASDDITIDHYRPQVSSLGVDSLGNLWIETNTSSWPSFLVLSQPSGDTLFSAEAPGLCDRRSTYCVRINASGIIVREVTESGSMIVYLMTTEET